MTRFARAKGSKASNERKEEEPTPWHVMRQQLADQLNNEHIQKNEDVSYSLKSILKSDSDLKNKEIWSDFGDITVSKTCKRKKIHKGEVPEPVFKEDKQKKNKKNKVSDSINNRSENKIKKHSGSNITKEKETNKVIVSESSKLNSKQIIPTLKNNKNIKSYKEPKKQKSNKPNVLKPENHYCDVPNNEVETASKCENPDLTLTSDQMKNNDKCKSVNVTSQTSKTSFFQNKSYGNIKNKNTSSWRNYNSKVQTIIANGREIKIVSFEGFLIKKDDASRLKTLRKKMRDQNISKDKIKAIMKLERRKAEKALSREKNTVCFHCRKFGHNFSDCPDIKDTELSKSGMCFKCGSLEHSHFECKVLQNQDFRYAVCFVCKEQGHIARQCSLNPQGQYPKGGSCHLCGEVTHLRKDCPRASDEKPSKSFTVEHLTSDKLEDISEVVLHTIKPEKRKKKVITF